MALHSVFPAGSRPGDVPELSTTQLLQDAISALLVTTREQWTVDVTRATVGDYHRLRALADAYRRAGRHHRQLALLGASLTVQRAALQLGGSEHSVAAGQVCPN